ncbi:TIGR02530 family flagellar biosynthesis protein [Clostridium algidicarnis]|uniref:Flagellar operon protein n=2 Tax=Clostridium algidicarnis TaxID=37659 RepID=A0A2S6G153_9CLOT|nr:TIGR02530 family flagellar biosynthesis protein [Clostridium algidicarnis]MBB6630457.1 flagellar biosynthesis protein [Clostridium algidicarnis]MBB6696406.1 flagellar biosynthesis protein [Clostridium algidicarnis]MBU3193951.1 flagellar biosynthesis protein [Clostridium algidicarnis]MBU3202968.1 flagellar biosynthesis protein [Clostridium algidicarnis]MBU3205733.1 flagellar biosynthesis protein [Clostridium algidicarnis]
MSYRIINGKPYLIDDLQSYKSKEVAKKVSNNKELSDSKSFKEVLELNIQKDIKISNHASERMKDLNLNHIDMENIKEGINKAEKKGSKNSLILYKDMAFVTSVQNRTIITVVDKERTKENVFTNIDSVVML